MSALRGLLPYSELAHRLAAAGGLPAPIAAFVLEKLREYARPFS